MLIWKVVPITISVAGTEIVQDIIGFQDGKARKIKFVAGPKTTNLWIKGYRASQQVVEFDTDLFTTGYTILPTDVTLRQGETFKAGFIDKGAGAATYNLAVAYEEND